MSIMAMTRATAGLQPVLRTSDADELTPSLQPSSGAVTAALESIVTYIPTEVVTAYVAVLGMFHVSQERSQTRQWYVFWAFLVITPFAVWAAMAHREKMQTGLTPLQPTLWPKYTAFNMTAALVSFALWGFSLPDTPFQELAWYSSKLGTAALIVGSLLLGYISPLFRAGATARQGRHL
ncbi:hypothetical protein [Streptomyces sp. NPDC102476]|uniref:hypothetical protein n=1 Tax=Streptomyces sp. NPDC102476 TaxID=3366181 RepID=UPI0038297B9C